MNKTLEFCMHPIIRLQSGRLAALTVIDPFSSEKPAPATAYRQWFTRLPDVVRELRTLGLARGRLLIVRASTAMLLDRACALALARTLDPRTAIHWVDADTAGGDARRGAMRLETLRRKTQCQIGLTVGPQSSPACRLLAPEWAWIARSLIDGSANAGNVYLQLLNTISEYRSRGARIAVEWMEGATDRRVAVSAGMEYGVGWAWPRRVGRPQSALRLREFGGSLVGTDSPEPAASDGRG